MERLPEFTEEERQQMESCARKLALVGEVAINKFVRARNDIFLYGLSVEHSAPIDQKLEIIRGISRQLHWNDVIIAQARLILELDGRDTTSELRRQENIMAWGKLGSTDSG